METLPVEKYTRELSKAKEAKKQCTKKISIKIEEIRQIVINKLDEIKNNLSKKNINRYELEDMFDMLNEQLLFTKRESEKYYRYEDLISELRDIENDIDSYDSCVKYYKA